VARAPATRKIGHLRPVGSAEVGAVSPPPRFFYGIGQGPLNAPKSRRGIRRLADTSALLLRRSSLRGKRDRGSQKSLTKWPCRRV